MDLTRDYRKRMVLEIIADEESGYDEISPFISAMKKIHQDSHKIGFKNRFTANERVVLAGIWEELKNHVQPEDEKIQERNSGKPRPTGL